MNFNSMVFIWVFLPIVLAINFLITVIKFKDERLRTQIKNVFLLVASLVFYAWGGLQYIGVIVFSILLNFFSGILMEKLREKQKVRKAIFIVVLLLNLAILAVFKYFNILISSIETLMNTEEGFVYVMRNLISATGTGELAIKTLVLPVGISFFTFMSMSYVVDVYKGEVEHSKNIIDFALYVSFFPKLVFGPIVQYSEMQGELYVRAETLDLFLQGLRRFCYGLAKKVIIADVLAAVANEIWALETSTIGSAIAWIGVGAYTLQIYYDFSGCSDMAIGLGNMFGFKFKENFKYPYTSLSIQEFWRRWHISLSDWFQKYIYFPLGGSRKGKARTFFNIFIVFLVTGLWHGENFRFLVWGLMYAVLQIIERLFLRKWLDKNPVKFFNWLYVMLSVMIGWVFFRAPDVFVAVEMLKQMFTFGTASGGLSFVSYLSMKRIVIFIVAILLSGFIQRALSKYVDKFRQNVFVTVGEYVWILALFAYSVFSIVVEGGSPALYGGF